MKIFVLISMLLSFNVFALSGREAWTHSNMNGKIWILNEYKAFFNQLALEEKTGELEEAQFSMLQLLINSAWAADMNCIYAGWPSKNVGNVCSSPLRHNPDYKSGSCSKNQLQCQPLLFGKNICVPVTTASERSLAFTNCDKKFQAMKKSPEALIKEIRADGNEAGLFELMDFADKICKQGKQSATGMCKRLEAAVDRLRHFKPQGKIEVSSTDKSKDRGPAVISRTRPSTQEKSNTKEELKQTVEKVNTAMAQVTSDPDCEVATSGDPFDRDEPRPADFEYTTARHGKDPSWDDTFTKDKTQGMRATGFEITNVGPNAIAGDPVDPRERTERKWRFASDDNSKRETYLWITDDSGDGYVSGLMDSVIMIVPRKMKPSIEAKGDEMHVTLTTGEKVIFDKKTKTIVKGALQEGKVDLNPNKRSRKFAPISYSGTGISIRVDRRGEDPRLIQGNAIVTQNGKRCAVPATDLWDSKADFKYTDDSKLLQVLNRRCGGKFKL